MMKPHGGELAVTAFRTTGMVGLASGSPHRPPSSPASAAAVRASAGRACRTHAAKRERPGREARAFTLNLQARQFRARLLK